MFFQMQLEFQIHSLAHSMHRQAALCLEQGEWRQTAEIGGIAGTSVEREREGQGGSEGGVASSRGSRRRSVHLSIHPRCRCPIASRRSRSCRRRQLHLKAEHAARSSLEESGRARAEPSCCGAVTHAQHDREISSVRHGQIAVREDWLRRRRRGGGCRGRASRGHSSKSCGRTREQHRVRAESQCAERRHVQIAPGNQRMLVVTLPLCAATAADATAARAEGRRRQQRSVFQRSSASCSCCCASMRDLSNRCSLSPKIPLSAPPFLSLPFLGHTVLAAHSPADISGRQGG